MKIAVLLAAFGGVLLGQQIQRSTPPETPNADVLQAVEAYTAAVLRSDAKKLATVLADDVVIVHSDGTADTRANFLDAIGSGRLRITTFDRTDALVRSYGSTAVVLSKTAKSFTYRGSPGRATDTSVITLSRAAGTWKIVAMQNTPRTD